MSEQNDRNEETLTPKFEVLAPSAVESINRAEVDIQISTAKRYPRDLVQVSRDIMSMATLNEATAASCFYTLPRGGKNIQGPSIRLAEIAISCFGNLRVGSRIISTDAQSQNPHVVIQATVFDLQKNVAVSIEKRRRITPKKDYKNGGHLPPSDDDVNLAVNSGTAIALRDATFKVIPLALINPVFEQAKKVAIGDAKTLTDRRAKCFDMFAKMGVIKERVLAFLEKTAIEAVDLGDIEKLIGVYNTIKDGEDGTNIDDVFPQVDAAGKFTPKPGVTGKPEDHPPGLEPKPAPANAVPAPKPEPPKAPAQTQAPPAAAAPEPEKAPEPPPAAAAPAPTTPAPEASKSANKKIEVKADDLEAVKKMCELAKVTEAQVCGYLKSKQLGGGALDLEELRTKNNKRLAFIRAKFPELVVEFKKMPGTSAQ